MLFLRDTLFVDSRIERKDFNQVRVLSSRIFRLTMTMDLIGVSTSNLFSNEVNLESREWWPWW